MADPALSSTGVGTNVAPRIVFNERLNPLSVVSSSNELYNHGSVELYNNATGQYVPATVSMSADRLTATLTPASALQPNTQYSSMSEYGARLLRRCRQHRQFTTSYFVTGSGTDTTPATVSTINPANTQTAVPLNAQIIAVMSDDIDPTTVTNSSITVTPSGGSAIAGTVTLASDGVTLTFVPAAALTAASSITCRSAASKTRRQHCYHLYQFVYDWQHDIRRVVQPGFDESGERRHWRIGDQPGHVHHEQPDQCGLGEPKTVYVYVNATNGVVAGTYSVSGASVTFTPLTQYPANTLMRMYIYGLTDEAGNLAYVDCGTFTTVNTVDNTPPTVTITPANGTANAGLNTQVVLTFSKSINPATITSSSVNLLNGDVPINPAISISRDNRTVVLNYNSSTLPAGATITVAATNQITDLSGNALANTTSQFTTTPAVSNAAPIGDQHAPRQWRDQCFRQHGDHPVYQRSHECWYGPGRSPRFAKRSDYLGHDHCRQQRTKRRIHA